MDGYTQPVGPSGIRPRISCTDPASLTSTCHRHDIDPKRYLAQLLTNLPATKVSDLDQWLPDAWKRRDAPPPI